MTMTLQIPLKVVPGPCGYWIMNRRPDSPETGHFLRARARAPAMGSKLKERCVWRIDESCPVEDNSTGAIVGRLEYVYDRFMFNTGTT